MSYFAKKWLVQKSPDAKLLLNKETNFIFNPNPKVTEIFTSNSFNRALDLAEKEKLIKSNSCGHIVSFAKSLTEFNAFWSVLQAHRLSPGGDFYAAVLELLDEHQSCHIFPDVVCSLYPVGIRDLCFKTAMDILLNKNRSDLALKVVDCVRKRQCSIMVMNGICKTLIITNQYERLLEYFWRFQWYNIASSTGFAMAVGVAGKLGRMDDVIRIVKIVEDLSVKVDERFFYWLIRGLIREDQWKCAVDVFCLGLRKSTLFSYETFDNLCSDFFLNLSLRGDLELMGYLFQKVCHQPKYDFPKVFEHICLGFIRAGTPEQVFRLFQIAKKRGAIIDHKVLAHIFFKSSNIPDMHKAVIEGLALIEVGKDVLYKFRMTLVDRSPLLKEMNALLDSGMVTSFVGKMQSFVDSGVTFTNFEATELVKLYEKTGVMLKYPLKIFDLIQGEIDPVTFRFSTTMFAKNNCRVKTLKMAEFFLSKEYLFCKENANIIVRCLFGIKDSTAAKYVASKCPSEWFDEEVTEKLQQEIN